jgi:hypothetical protein
MVFCQGGNSLYRKWFRLSRQRRRGASHLAKNTVISCHRQEHHQRGVPGDDAYYYISGLRPKANRTPRRTKHQWVGINIVLRYYAAEIAPGREKELSMSKGMVFLIRAVLGVGGGWVLSHFFFDDNLVIWAILSVLVIAAAYASEFWRGKK